jgi:hypothetical protein
MGEFSDVVDAITYLETAGFVTGEFCTSTAARAPVADPSIPVRDQALVVQLPY